jgi:membrane fusion protein, multidrug efflux system
MKNVIIGLVVILLASCSIPREEKIKKQIQQKKNQVNKIEKKIRDLEKELADTLKDNTIPVAIKVMKGGKFDHYFIVSGNVEAEEYAIVSPEMGGQIRKIHVSEGDYVQKGKLLVSLNTNAIQNSIDQAKAARDLAKTTYEKQKKLWDQKIGSQIQYLQAKTAYETAEASLKTLEAQKNLALIHAPFKGYVDRIYVKEGELGSPGVPVLEVVNLKKLKIKADVPEIYIEKIKKGDKVKLNFTSISDTVEAHIAWISKVIDRANRTFQIEVHINNPGEKIKPNMISKITINDFSADSALVIPTIIIKKDTKGSFLYKVEKRDSVLISNKVYIKPGYSYQDSTMVVKGLKQGDKVIIDGYNIVSSGIEVKVKN